MLNKKINFLIISQVVLYFLILFFNYRTLFSFVSKICFVFYNVNGQFDFSIFWEAFGVISTVIIGTVFVVIYGKKKSNSDIKNAIKLRKCEKLENVIYNQIHGNDIINIIDLCMNINEKNYMDILTNIDRFCSNLKNNINDVDFYYKNEDISLYPVYGNNRELIISKNNEILDLLTDLKCIINKYTNISIYINYQKIGINNLNKNEKKGYEKLNTEINDLYSYAVNLKNEINSYIETLIDYRNNNSDLIYEFYTEIIYERNKNLYL